MAVRLIIDAATGALYRDFTAREEISLPELFAGVRGTSTTVQVYSVTVPDGGGTPTGNTLTNADLELRIGVVALASFAGSVAATYDSTESAPVALPMNASTYEMALAEIAAVLTDSGFTVGQLGDGFLVTARDVGAATSTPSLNVENAAPPLYCETSTIHAGDADTRAQWLVRLVPAPVGSIIGGDWSTVTSGSYSGLAGTLSLSTAAAAAAMALDSRDCTLDIEHDGATLLRAGLRLSRDIDPSGNGALVLTSPTLLSLGGTAVSQGAAIALSGLTFDGATLTASGGGGGSITWSNALFVTKNGNDGTASAGRLDLPYLTVAAALAAATSGQSVVVLTGDYDERGLWPTNDRVHLHLCAGARIRYTGVTGGGVIDTTGGSPHTFYITGEAGAAIQNTTTGGGNRAAIFMEQAATVRAAGVDLYAEELGTAFSGSADFEMVGGVVETNSDGVFDLFGAATVRLRGVRAFSGDGIVLEMDHASALVEAQGCAFATGDRSAIEGTAGTVRLRGCEVTNNADGDATALLTSALALDASGCRFANSGTEVDIYVNASGLAAVPGCSGSGTDGALRTAGAGTVSPAAAGDMLAATYDPNTVGGDAFDMGNMVEAADAKVLTAAERSAIAAATSGVSTNAAAIAAIQVLLASDETSLDTLQEIVDFIELNRADLDALTIASIAGLQAALDAKLAPGDIDTLAELNAIVGDATLLSAAAIAAAYQPKDSDLTAIAALSTTSFGRGLLELVDAAALRTAAALGDAATLDVGTTAGTVAAGDDARLSDARKPTRRVLVIEVNNPDGIASGDGWTIEDLEFGGSIDRWRMVCLDENGDRVSASLTMNLYSDAWAAGSVPSTSIQGTGTLPAVSSASGAENSSPGLNSLTQGNALRMEAAGAAASVKTVKVALRITPS